MKKYDVLVNEALEMLKNDDDLFVEMVNELDNWNGYADGFRAYPMDEINDLFCDVKVSDFLDKLAPGFNLRDDYFVDSIYGIDSTDHIADLYRDNVDEGELLDNIIDNYNHLYFYNDEFKELVEEIVNYDENDENDVIDTVAAAVRDIVETYYGDDEKQENVNPVLA